MRASFFPSDGKFLEFLSKSNDEINFSTPNAEAAIFAKNLKKQFKTDPEWPTFEEQKHPLTFGRGAQQSKAKKLLACTFHNTHKCTKSNMIG